MLDLQQSCDPRDSFPLIMIRSRIGRMQHEGRKDDKTKRNVSMRTSAGTMSEP